MEIRLTIYGVAVPAGSKRGFPVRTKDGRIVATVAPDNKKQEPWQAQVRSEAIKAMNGKVMLGGPLAARAVFYVPRPKGHFGARGNVRPGAPAYPAVKPDVTKLWRCVEDSLSKIVWRDDAQVVHEEIAKLYGEPARCEITVRPIDAATVQEATTEFEQLGLLRVS